MNFTQMSLEAHASIVNFVQFASPGYSIISFSDFNLADGLLIKFANGWSVLTNWGFGSASSNNDATPTKCHFPAPDAEVALLNPDGLFTPLTCIMRQIDLTGGDPTHDWPCDGEHENGYALHRCTPDRFAMVIAVAQTMEQNWPQAATLAGHSVWAD